MIFTVAQSQPTSLVHREQGSKPMAVRNISDTFRDGDGRENSQFLFERYGVVGRVVSPDGAMLAVPQHQIRQCMASSDGPTMTSADLVRSVQGVLAFAYDSRANRITVWPQFEAAANDPPGRLWTLNHRFGTTMEQARHSKLVKGLVFRWALRVGTSIG